MSSKVDLRTRLLNPDNADAFRSEVREGASLRAITRVVCEILEKHPPRKTQELVRKNFQAAIEGKQARFCQQIANAQPITQVILKLLVYFFYAIEKITTELSDEEAFEKALEKGGSALFGTALDEATALFKEFDFFYQNPWIISAEKVLTTQEIEQLLQNRAQIPQLPHGQQKVLKKGARFPRNILVDGDQAYLLLHSKKDPVLGSGGTSKAWKAIDLQTGKECVILSTNLIDDDREIRIQKHIDLTQKLRPSGFFPELHATKTVQNIKGDKKSWRICEYCDLGELGNFKYRLKASEAQRITLDILHGVKELHTKGYVHNDLHAGNVVLYRDEQGHIRAKLIDLEFAEKIGTLGILGVVEPARDIRECGLRIFPKISELCDNEAFRKSLDPIAAEMVKSNLSLDQCIANIQAIKVS